MVLALAWLASGATLTSGQVSSRRPDPDPAQCFNRAWRSTQNAIQAYQLVRADSWNRDLACRGASDSPCWGPLLESRSFVERAAAVFDRARRTPQPKEGQLVGQGNDLLRQASEKLKEARDCAGSGRLLQGRADLTRPPLVLRLSIPPVFSIFVPGLQNIADVVNFLSTYHPVETAYVGIGIAGGRLATLLAPNPVGVADALGGKQYSGTAAPVRALDAAVSREAPVVKALDRPISPNAGPNEVLRRDIEELRRMGARFFRVNQQQVTEGSQRVGINRPDLQFTYKGQRYYVEYDTVPQNGVAHAARILANDPNAIIILKTFP